MKYIKYKTYIQKGIKKVVETTTVMAKKVTKKNSKKKTETTVKSPSSAGSEVTFGSDTTSSTIDISNVELGAGEPPLTPANEKPHGHFEGVNWVWPNGQKTHVRFIDIAIRKMKPLPRGFYIEAEKETYLTNMKAMLRKAIQLKLPDSVDIRNKEEE